MLKIEKQIDQIIKVAVKNYGNSLQYVRLSEDKKYMKLLI
jgi:hypothetical protein